MSSISKKRKLIYLAIPLVLFVVILLFIEIGIRMFATPITSLDFFVHPQHDQRTEVTEGQGVFEGDPTLGWRLKSNLNNAYWDFTTFSTNKQRVRYPTTIKDKDDQTIRIITMGDSVTFGYRVPTTFPENYTSYNPTHQPYALLLEDLLEQTYEHYDFQVIPMAVPGYTTHQGKLWLMRDIAKFDPDIVTVLYGWNDTDPRITPDSLTFPEDATQNVANSIIVKSQALLRLHGWLNAPESPQQPTTIRELGPRVSQDEYIDNILTIHNIAQAHGATTLVMGTVYRDSVSNPDQAKRIRANRDALRTMTTEQQIDYIEFPQLIETAHPDNKDLFGELIHPNHKGHQIMAQAIHDYMVQNKLILRPKMD